MIDMASKQILPVCVKYAGGIAASVRELSGAGIDTEVEKELLSDAAGQIDKMKRALDTLKTETEKIVNVKDVRERAFFCRDVIIPAMAALREPADALELIVDKKLWPLPTYGELMFEV